MQHEHNFVVRVETENFTRYFCPTCKTTRIVPKTSHFRRNR